MAKLKNDKVTSNDLIEYLESQSDFNFELRVLKMLRENGLDCDHGGHYEDPVTKKSREFDIRAVKTIGQLRVRMAIECKNIREHFPILISCVPRHKSESYHQIAYLNEPSNSPLGAVHSLHQSRAKTFSIRDQHSLYKEGEPVGKSTVQVGRQQNDNSITANDSELFEKWGQCLSSSHDLVEQTYWDGYDEKESFKSALIPFVVVPNGRLWTVNFNEDGERVSEPTPTDRCSCYIDKDYIMGTEMASERMWLSHMEIITFDGLLSFVEQYLKSEAGINEIFPEEGFYEAMHRALKT
ncbi:hypothetical protein N9V89_04060 [Pseudoalteromonas sp.]|nr:hypothetical protein [Pseudoalteromonas sp.]